MSRLKIPSREEILELAQVRTVWPDDVCISLYVETSPLRLNWESCRIELNNQVRKALAKLEEEGFNKKHLPLLRERLEEVANADSYSLFRANSLAVMATLDSVRLYRLANKLNTQLEMSDRFYLKPLLRALTFRHTAYILALSENEARVIELLPDAEPEVLHLPSMPRNAQSAIGLPDHISINATGAFSPLRPRRLAEYARKVEDAIKPLLRECDSPVILVAAEPLASAFRSVSSICLADNIVFTSPDKLPDHELAALARPVLDRHYARQLGEVRALFDERRGQDRVVTELQDLARAATYGMIGLMLVDFDRTQTGYIDDEGNLEFSDDPGAYGILDEIVKRAIESGAKILAVRNEDMLGNTGGAAILRYPLPEMLGKAV